MRPGGWKLENFKATELPEKVASAFTAVTKDLVGATYTPVLYCGQQIVKGVNYMLICEITLSDKEGTQHLAQMIINEFQGEYYIVNIQTII